MASKKSAKQTKEAQPAKTSEKSAIEKKESNFKVIIGLLVVGIGFLLFLLFQNQTTINDQRTTISEQQQQIIDLEAKVEEFENNPLKTILDSAGEQIIEKGTEILEEIISPQ